jgi:hypothetical protein
MNHPSQLTNDEVLAQNRAVMKPYREALAARQEELKLAGVRLTALTSKLDELKAMKPDVDARRGHLVLDHADILARGGEVDRTKKEELARARARCEEIDTDINDLVAAIPVQRQKVGQAEAAMFEARSAVSVMGQTHPDDLSTIDARNHATPGSVEPKKVLQMSRDGRIR